MFLLSSIIKRLQNLLIFIRNLKFYRFVLAGLDTSNTNLGKEKVSASVYGQSFMTKCNGAVWLWSDWRPLSVCFYPSSWNACEWISWPGNMALCQTNPYFILLQIPGRNSAFFLSFPGYRISKDNKTCWYIELCSYLLSENCSFVYSLLW